MKKYFLIAVLIIIICISFIYFIFNNEENQPEETPDSEENIILEEKTIIELLELLPELEKDDSQKSELNLLLLSQRKSAIGYYSSLILAEKYEETGKSADLFYRKALELYPTDGVRFMLAEYLAKKEDKTEAIKEYIELISYEDALDALTKIEPSLIKTSQGLIDEKMYEKAIELLEPKVENETDVDFILKKNYAIALAQTKNYTDALNIFKVLKQEENADDEIVWWYAYCLEKTGQKSVAIQEYKTIGEEGAYRLGLLLDGQGLQSDSAEAFIKSIHSYSKWMGARMLEEQGKHEKALETYLALTEDDEDIHYDDALFRAYILTKRLGKEGAEELLEKLSKYPAWMERLGESPKWEELKEEKYEKPDFFKRWETYIQYGKVDAAEVELEIGKRIAKGTEMLYFGDWYVLQDDYFKSCIWGSRAIEDTPSKKGYELAYPRPFEETVMEISQDYDIDPYFIWAIMREESRYRPEVVSWAGAIGLMQIMPSTGKGIASSLGTSITNEGLKDPETNIRFGTYYISAMLKNYSGDKDRALAAYNGGAGNVNRWLKSKIGSTKQDFPASITYQETREYITKVMNSYYTYKWLYDSEN